MSGEEWRLLSRGEKALVVAFFAVIVALAIAIPIGVEVVRAFIWKKVLGI